MQPFAILGYFGVVGYLHQFDKENATQLLMENRYTGEQEKWQKPYLIIAVNIAIVQTHLFHFIQKFPIVVMKCNRIFKVDFELSAWIVYLKA